MINGILDPRLPNPEKEPWIEELLKKKMSVSISTEGVGHRITCYFTDRDAKVGL